MTNGGFRKAAKAIWKEACDKAVKLVKSQGVKIFDDYYSFHRYIKHKDGRGEIKTGNELMMLFLTDRDRDFFLATPVNIDQEKKRCRREAAKECKRQIEDAKNRIIKNESLLAEIESGKKDIDYDVF